MSGRVTRQARAPEDVELIAWLLDNSIPIPGTGRRVGLDAVIGLVPGLGDVITAALGVLVVGRAAQHGVPLIVIARMLLNMGIDLVVGAIPLLGDAFDFVWKSNARNVDLFRRYAYSSREDTRGDWAFVLGVLGVAVLLVVALLVGVAWLVGQLIGAIS